MNCGTMARGRPPTPVGSFGAVSVREVGPGRFEASARVRDADGVARRVRARGRSRTAAERELKVRLVDRSTGGAAGGELGASTTVRDLCALWLVEAEQDGRRASQTVAGYARVVETVIVPALGGLRLGELTTARVDAMISAVYARAPSQAKQARVVLMQACALACRRDAMRVNPVRDSSLPRSAGPDPRALTLADVGALRARMAAYVAGEDPDTGERRAGRPAPDDLARLVDVMLGSGMRIGEVLGLRWCDVTGLDDDAGGPVRATVAGTLVTVAGDGLRRQDHPKSAAGWRTVTLPAFAVAALREQRAARADLIEDVGTELTVFCSPVGGLRWPGSVRKAWRVARGEAYDWITPHTLRRTVATIVEADGGGLGAASRVLGHSGQAVTERHYIARAALAPDVSEVLEAFGR